MSCEVDVALVGLPRHHRFESVPALEEPERTRFPS
jgi:hypothetical protein